MPAQSAVCDSEPAEARFVLERLTERNSRLAPARTITLACQSLLLRGAQLEASLREQRLQNQTLSTLKDDMAADFQALRRAEASESSSAEHIHLLQQQLEHATDEAAANANV